MKTIHYLLITLCMVFGSCATIDERDDFDVQSNITFMKNTLEYPVLAQSYFHKFDGTENYCQKKAIAWSKPILIQSGEYKIIMDYVIPQRIKIFTVDTVLIVNIPCGWTERKEINFDRNVLKINETEAKKMNNIEGNPYSYYKDDRYLLQNVPWDIYPIEYDQVPCGNLQSGVFSAIKKYREEDYYDRSNGYAIIRFFEINPKATCFNP